VAEVEQGKLLPQQLQEVTAVEEMVLVQTKTQ
jgi:hypothetical protein